jgi:hypothetical protein
MHMPPAPRRKKGETRALPPPEAVELLSEITAKDGSADMANIIVSELSQQQLRALGHRRASLCR